MRQERFSLSGSLSQYFAMLLLCTIFIFVVSSTAQAQSGRRMPKRTNTPTSSPQPAEPEQPTKPTVTKPESKLPLIVGTNQLGQSLNIPLYLHDTVVDGFLKRLRESFTLNVTVEKNMNRKEAIERAKSGAETYVVLLQLDTESFDADAALGRVDPRSLIVTYIAFAPGTGKIKTQGRVYQSSYRGILGRRTPPMRSATEYQLYEAGREAAQRVMNALQIAPPPAERR